MKIVLAALFLLTGYIGGFFLSSVLLRQILHYVDPTIEKKIRLKDIGVWIGICEHFLIITFILAKEYTSIGLIFAAKEIVRSDKIREKPSYYLLGTLLSISFAILFGFMIQGFLSLLR